MAEPTYEELLKLAPAEEAEAKPVPAAPVQELSTGEAGPSYDELLGLSTGAPVTTVTNNDLVDAAQKEDFTASEYLTNKAKLGMASLLSLGGLPLDFIQGLQYTALDMFEGLDSGAIQLQGPKFSTQGGPRDREIRGVPAGPEAFKTIKPTLPYGFQQQKDAYEQILFADFDQETDNLGMKTAGTIAEFAGGGLIPGGAIVAKTQGLSRKMIVAATEVASTVAGGVGTELGGETGKGIHPSLETPARVLFGTAGALSPYALPGQALPAIFSRIKGWMDPKTQAKIGKEKAVELIKKELGDVPAALDQLRESERLRQNIPGYSPSLGMETNSAGIKSIEKRFAAETTKGNALAVAAEKNSIDAIMNRANEIFPSPGISLTSLPEDRLAAVRNSFVSDIKGIDRQINALEQGIKRGDPEQIGKSLRILRDQKEAASRAIKNSKYEDFYRAAEDANITVAPETIRDIAKRVIGDEGLTFQKKSPVMQKIASKYLDKEPGTDAAVIVDNRGTPFPVAESDISMREFHSMYKEVNRELGIARQGMERGDQEAGHLYFQLSKLKKEFAKNIDGLKSSEFGEVATKLNEADGYFLNQYQKVFREGVGGRMDAYNRFGDVTPDEKIVSDLVMKRASGLDEFRLLYGEGQEAQTLLENGVMDMFARSAIKDGSYNPTGAVSFLHKHNDVLNKMPELKAVLMDKNKGYQALATRQKVLNQKIKGLNKARLQSLTGMNDTDELIAFSMGDPKRMTALARTVKKSGDPQAMEALKHGVADHAMKQKDPFEYFLANEKQMEVVYGKNSKHYQDLKDLSEARRIISRKFDTQQVDTSLQAEDFLKKKIGTSAVEAMTMARWVQASRLSPEYVISQMASKGVLKFRQAEMNRVMEEALYDPGVAKLLLEMTEKIGKIKPTSARAAGNLGLSEGRFAERFKEVLFSVGARTTAATASKDELVEE